MNRIWWTCGVCVALLVAVGLWGAANMVWGMGRSAYLVDALPTENTVETPELARGP